MTLRTVLLWFGAIAGPITLLARTWLTLTSRLESGDNLVGALAFLFTFFTHLTNLWLVLTYVAVLSGWRAFAWFARPIVMASAAAFITLVMLYYHFMLAPTLDMQGGLLVATWLLHYVAPIIYLVWWALFAPHGMLRFPHIGLMLLPGIGYVAWVLLRGAIVHEYPYDILDAGKFGYGGVAIGVAVLLVAVTIFSIVLLVADRLLARRSAPV